MRRSMLRQREGQERIKQELRRDPEQSLDDLSLRVFYSRSTVHILVKSLIATNEIRKVRGRGRRPNSYIVLSQQERA